MGRIAGAGGRAPARTPLQARLDRLSRLLIPIAAGICATLALLSYLQGDALAHSVLVGVSLAVAALPEGLPAVVTITLALSMRQMAEHGAIVRRLAAVETLGSTTVICSDKTGTLTENRLAVQRLLDRARRGEAELLEGAVLASRGVSRPIRSSWRSSRRPTSAASAASARWAAAASWPSDRSTPSASG